MNNMARIIGEKVRAAEDRCACLVRTLSERRLERLD
jgi:hypothetical protein